VFRSLSAARAATVSLGAIAVAAIPAAAQQSDLSISPFVAFLPSAGTSPLAGLALTLAGNGGLGVRASAHLALENNNNNYLMGSGALRPWGADADLVLSLGGRSLRGTPSIAPYAFAGVGSSNAATTNWSYGAGLSIPLGADIDLFGESRWRMSRFVLPTASMAPSPTTELRVGLSFHVGGGGTSRDEGRRSHGRRMSVALPPGATATLPALPPGARYPITTASAARVLNTADQFLGAPYRYGGTLPSGFDCSGFVQYVFAREDVRLPRTASEQAQVGVALAPDWRAVSAGDLVMFEENGRIDHVAIYAGHNRIIHSSASGGGVRYDDLSTPRGEWFVDHMVAARRVTPDASGLVLDLARGFATRAADLDPPDHAPKPAR
jgi:hypothetical protein